MQIRSEHRVQNSFNRVKLEIDVMRSDGALLTRYEYQYANVICKLEMSSKQNTSDILILKLNSRNIESESEKNSRHY